MHSNIFKVFVAGIALLVSGCAHVTFYSDPELKTKTGLIYFEPKPYILVAKKDKDQADISIVYLPDKSKPQYAVFTPGLGTHQFSVNVNNGILTSYGQTADSKIPELINSVAGLLKEGTATAASAGALGMVKQGTTDIAPLKSELNDIAETLYKAVKENKMSENQKALNRISDIKDNLKGIASNIIPTFFNKDDDNAKKRADVISNLKSVYGELDNLVVKLPDRFNEMSPSALYNDALTKAKNRIDAVITIIKGDPEPTPAFELYEIVLDDKGYFNSLKRVR